MSTVWGFFYGGLINPEVMEKVGMRPTEQEIATLPGYDIRIRPLVNLIPDAGSVVYGLLLHLTHDELDKVYSQLKATYFPQPVLTFTLDGKARPALCYIIPRLPDGEADAEHVLSLLRPAEDLGFPAWYLEKIRGFLPVSSP